VASARKPLVGQIKQLKRKYKIFIDAGHGSKNNTGNYSTFCTDEQDYTLLVAGSLAEYLKKSGRFKVRVSREKNRKVGYRQRLKSARVWKADVIISIHSDARGQVTFWQPVAGKVCRKNLYDAGFAVLWADNRGKRLNRQRRKLARKIAQKMLQAGFLAYDGNDYIGLYEKDVNTPGVFVERHLPGQRILFLNKPKIPSVIIETHHALDPREELLWRREKTLEIFATSLEAALVEYFLAD
jgi:N-acetylmuramoyl-L-alanine amidase